MSSIAPLLRPYFPLIRWLLRFLSFHDFEWTREIFTKKGGDSGKSAVSKSTFLISTQFEKACEARKFYEKTW